MAAAPMAHASVSTDASEAPGRFISRRRASRSSSMIDNASSSILPQPSRLRSTNRVTEFEAKAEQRRKDAGLSFEEKVEIGASAVLHADIVARSIAVAKGAVIDGDVTVTSGQPVVQFDERRGTS